MSLRITAIQPIEPWAAPAYRVIPKAAIYQSLVAANEALAQGKVEVLSDDVHGWSQYNQVIRIHWSADAAADYLAVLG